MQSNNNITIEKILQSGVTLEFAVYLLNILNASSKTRGDPDRLWQFLSQVILINSPFSLHLLIFESIFPDWKIHPESAPAWIPDLRAIHTTNIYQFMQEEQILDVPNFHQWTVKNYTFFWQKIIKKLNICFQIPFKKIADLKSGVMAPNWLCGAKLNIVDSCFNAPPSSTAIIYENENKSLISVTYAELHQLTLEIANSLIAHGFKKNDAIGICMPMNINAIAIYLGIIKMGGIVVSIADSFSSEEIGLRLKIANTQVVFTQYTIQWGEKHIFLYKKITNATINKIIVLTSDNLPTINLRKQDCHWDHFIIKTSQPLTIACDPMDWCNILFSSGTTAQPKAIPWNHVTPIKVASDAYFHQNVQPGDVLTWPTNLGWMMGPWLIFAAFINQATIAIYEGMPKGRAFGEFISRAKVNILGVVPTLVANWRQTRCMENLNWQQHIKLFTSTGECSHPDDMLYLMSLAGYKPVIEYCGGTEIGGAYISSTIIEKNYPSLFSTPVMGIDFILLNENEQVSNIGEVAIIPPSIGLSNELLNADHQQIYYAGMPKKNGHYLRRHGDQLKRLPNNYYCILGRTDDNMNLGGIKVSAAEIERVIGGLPHIIECAAIALPPQEIIGPSQLIIYVVAEKNLDALEIKQEMQNRINQQLNPFFKIHQIIFINNLPKTASNKIMRRELRKEYIKNMQTDRH